MKKYFFLLIVVLFSYSAFSQETVKTNDINKFFNPGQFNTGIQSIKVYTKKECSRCEHVVATLKQENIDFSEFDLNNQAVYSEIDSRIYTSLPYKELGYSINFPIIELNNTVFFCIDDHNSFVADLIKFIRGN